MKTFQVLAQWIQYLHLVLTRLELVELFHWYIFFSQVYYYTLEVKSAVSYEHHYQEKNEKFESEENLQ